MVSIKEDDTPIKHVDERCNSQVSGCPGALHLRKSRKPCLSLLHRRPQYSHLNQADSRCSSKSGMDPERTSSVIPNQ